MNASTTEISLALASMDFVDMQELDKVRVWAAPTVGPETCQGSWGPLEEAGVGCGSPWRQGYL